MSIGFRLSGTGTHGTILRIYLKIFEPDSAYQNQDPQRALKDLIEIADESAHIHELTRRSKPTIIA